MADQPPSAPPSPPPPPVYAYAAPYPVPEWALRGPAPGVVYAGFWIRFLAYVIDSVIINIPLAAIGFALIAPSLTNISCATVAGPFGPRYACTGLDVLGSAVPLLGLAGLILGGTYFAFCWTRFGRTLGQRVCGIRVVDAATGGPIPAGRAIGRYIGLIVSTWVLYIGLIWAAFDPRKQGWHDKMASTFAVRKG